MILSRQGLPVLEGTKGNHDAIAKGGYVLADSDDAQVVLVGAGSEVQHCVTAAGILKAEGISSRVVSLPCWEIFDSQDQKYRDSVLTPGLPSVSIEAGTTMGWAKYADVNIGIDRFGASAPGDVVMDKLGINPDSVVNAARGLLS